MNQNSSYKQIFKATSIFGGAQVLNILISIVRSKFIAILLGPTGMGIAGLLTSTTNLIGGLTNFGLSISAVRDVAAAKESNNIKKISRVTTILRKMVWITGLIGAFTTLFLSPLLSRITFGNKEYTTVFVWLSITLLLNQLTSGQIALLQGMRKLKYLAKANIFGSAIGLMISIPVYYFMKIDGIVPAIICSSFLSLVIAWYFASRIKIQSTIISTKESFLEGKGMLKMGLTLSLSGLVTTLSSYIVRIFISNTGGVDDVGLYSAGFAIIFTYVGLIFTAMGTDYYPRLSGVAHDNIQSTMLVNQQSEIAILILSPILTIFLVFIRWAVILLYSAKFAAIDTMIHWAALGIYFKAISWAIGYIMLAKGSSKTFFMSEVAANVYMLLFNILGFKYLGLDGLGISLFLSYILVFIQVLLIARFKYGFTFTEEFLKISSLQFCLGLICFLITKTLPVRLAYFTGVPVILISFFISYKELDKRLEIKKNLLKILKKQPNDS